MPIPLMTVVARVATSFTKGAKASIATYVGRLVAARTRRIQQDMESYQSFRAYCRANDLNSISGDDWKTAACDKDSRRRSA